MADEALSVESAAGSASHPAGGAVTRRSELAGVAVCVAFGVLMSALPYALWWPRVGELVWMADYDELYYLQFAGQAYFHHPAYLSDPVVAASASGSAYSTVSLAPGIIAARLLSLGPMGAAFFWRLGAGVGVGATTFLLLRHYLRRPSLAAALACLLMADGGMLSCHLVVRQALIAARVWAGRAGELLAANPKIHTEWRVINPGPSLPFLLLHVLLIVRARERPTPLRLGLAGVGFGLLFYVYFYYYTAACLALVLALAIDAGHRKVYAHAAWVGGLIGLPGVVGSYLFQRSTSSDWLHRTDKFLPIAHFSQLMIPWVGCVLLAIGLTWAALRRKDLMYVGLLALVALGLANNQMLTGLQIENFHWGWVWGPMISYLTVILTAEALSGLVSRVRGAVAVLLSLLALHLGVGVWLRAVEVTRTREPVDLMGEYVRYRADRRAAGFEPLAPDSVIAGDQRFVHLATVLEDQRPLTGYAARLSPYVDNASWNERIALNAYLLGLEASRFEAEQRRILQEDIWGPWARDPAVFDALMADRVAAFRAVEADCRRVLDRYAVRYVALPAGGDLPPAIRSGWRRVRTGATWDLLTRAAKEAARPPAAAGTHTQPM